MSGSYDNLNDDELRIECISHGINVGPVTPSTRKVYIKKLVNAISGQNTSSKSKNSRRSSPKALFQSSSPPPSPARTVSPARRRTTVFAVPPTPVTNERPPAVSLARHPSPPARRSSPVKQTYRRSSPNVLQPFDRVSLDPSPPRYSNDRSSLDVSTSHSSTDRSSLGFSTSRPSNDHGSLDVSTSRPSRSPLGVSTSRPSNDRSSLGVAPQRPSNDRSSLGVAPQRPSNNRNSLDVSTSRPSNSSYQKIDFNASDVNDEDDHREFSRYIPRTSRTSAYASKPANRNASMNSSFLNESTRKIASALPETLNPAFFGGLALSAGVLAFIFFPDNVHRGISTTSGFVNYIIMAGFKYAIMPFLIMGILAGLGFFAYYLFQIRKKQNAAYEEEKTKMIKEILKAVYNAPRSGIPVKQLRDNMFPAYKRTKNDLLLWNECEDFVKTFDTRVRAEERALNSEDEIVEHFVWIGSTLNNDFDD